MKKQLLALVIVAAAASSAHAQLGIGINKDTSLQGTGSVASPLGVNFTNVQKRVGSSCAPGSSIRAIDSLGVVTCETDDNTFGGSSGTSNTIAKFTGPTSLGNSRLTDDGTDVAIASQVMYMNDGVTSRLRFVAVGGNNYIQSGVTGAASAAPLIFANVTASSEWARFTTTGELGINDNSPTNKLTVTGAASATLGLYTDEARTVGINQNGTTLQHRTGSSDNRLDIDTSGNIYSRSDDTYFGWDAQAAARIGFMKKTGAVGKAAYGSGNEFVIAQSNAASIAAGGTFTDRFALDTSGNARFSDAASSGTLQGGTKVLVSRATGDVALSVQTRGEDRDVFIGVDDTNDIARIGTTVAQILAFRTSNTNRMHLDSTGKLNLGDLGISSIADNIDALAIGNTGTGQTASNALINLAHSGTFDVTAVDRTARSIFITQTASRSAGANNLINNGIEISVSGGQLNRALVANTGDVIIGVTSGNFEARRDAAVFGNTTLGDNATVDTTLVNGFTTIRTGASSSTTAASAAGTVLELGQVDGTNNYLTFRSTAQAGLRINNASGAGDAFFVADASRNFLWGTGATVRNQLDVNGSMFEGDTTNTAIADNVDVHTIGNTGTGQSTTDKSLLKLSHTGSFTTAGGNVTYYGADIATSATESAGSNTLTAVALRATATNGDERIAGWFKAGTSSGLATSLTGTVAIIEQANGTADYLQFRSNTTAGIAWAGSGTGGDGKLIYDQSVNAMQFATSNAFRGAILSTGAWQLGDTSGSAVSDNVDVIEVGNSGTGQTTTGKALVLAARTGSTSTSGGNVTNYTGNFTSSTTESAGANTLTNVAVRASTTAGDVALAFWADDGDLQIDDKTYVANEGVSVTNCGTGATISGNETGGVITPGTGSPTSCELNFTAAFRGSYPACVGIIEGISGILNIGGSGGGLITTSKVTWQSSVTLAGDRKIHYHCFGRP